MRQVEKVEKRGTELKESGRGVASEGLRTRLAAVASGHAFRYLLVGGLSFVIDLGLLVLLHEVFFVDLLVATPIAFLTSLLFNFVLQRFFTFKATNSHRASIAKYVLLVVFNTVATDVIVTAFEHTAAGYQIGKVVSTALMTVWNFFLYKYWIFKGTSESVVEGRSQAVVDL